MKAAVIVQWLDEFAPQLEHDCTEEFTADELAHVLVALRDCRADMATVQADLERRLIAEMGEKAFTVEGLGVVECHKRIKRTEWDHDELWRRVTALALDERKLDEESGEYEPAHEAVARVLSECARPSWRVTALRKHGVDPSEWCHEEFDGYGLRLPARAS